jgi:hypothetical protein
LAEYGKATGMKGEELYGKVILLPEFAMNAAGAWEPMEDAVIRAVKNPNDPTASMMRYATIMKEAGKPKFRYTNEFMSASELQVLLIMENLQAGSVTSGKLLIQESLAPFNKTNPARDIKWADQAAGLKCMVEDMPIYRRTVFTNDLSKTDTLITHTNGEELSKAYTVKLGTGNKANSSAIQQAGLNALNTPVVSPATPTVDIAALEARADELEAIPEAARTRPQKKELKEILEKLAVA